LPNLIPEEITFADGLVGCSDWRRFRLIESDEAEPIGLLQSLDDADVGFYVVDPYLIAEDYELEMPPSATRGIGLADWNDALVLCMLVVRQEPLLVTANLLGPLVINRTSGMGVQVVLSGSGYSSRHMVADAAGAGECSF
jgi:flagellar assembly factor FliW